MLHLSSLLLRERQHIGQQDLFVISIIREQYDGSLVGHSRNFDGVEFAVLPVFGQASITRLPSDRCYRRRRCMLLPLVLPGWGCWPASISAVVVVGRMTWLLVVVRLTGALTEIHLCKSGRNGRNSFLVMMLAWMVIMMTSPVMTMSAMMISLLGFNISAVTPFTKITIA